MSIESFDEIVDFILENRKNSSFIAQTHEDVRDYVIMALNTDTCVVHRGHNGEIDGVVFWEVRKYIPISIEITEAISKGKRILGEMLQEICNIMPISFRCFAKRKMAAKELEYINPRRIVRLLLKLNQA